MFHFHIRDVLFLTLVVAVALGWYLDRRWLRQQPQRDMQVKLLKKIVQAQDAQIQEDWRRIDALSAKLDELRASPDLVKLPAGYRWKRTINGKVLSREPRPELTIEQEPNVAFDPLDSVP